MNDVVLAVVLPLAAGAAAGVTAALAPRAVALVLALAAAGALGGFGVATLDVHALPFGSGDVVVGLALAALGAGLAANLARLRCERAAALTLGVVVALGLGEGAARWGFERPEDVALPWNAGARATLAPVVTHHRFDEGYHHNVLGTAARVCSAIFPELDPSLFEERTKAVGSRPVVLHLGDSMLEGTGVGGPAPDGRTFVARLQALDPVVAHVNVGVSGSGPDASLGIATAWSARLPVRAFLLYLFLENDLADLHIAYPCCGLERLLNDDEDQPVLRCPSRRPMGLLHRWALVTASPWLLRALIDRSALARLLVARTEGWLVNRLGRVLERVDEAAAEARLLRVVVALERLAEEKGATLAVVVLPERTALAAPTEPRAARIEARRARALAMLQRENVVALDANEIFTPAVAPGQPPLGFLTGPNGSPDDHFDDDGHARMAAWLQKKLFGGVR